MSKKKKTAKKEMLKTIKYLTNTVMIQQSIITKLDYEVKESHNADGSIDRVTLDDIYDRINDLADKVCEIYCIVSENDDATSVDKEVE